MTKIRMKAVREMNAADLTDKIHESRAELSRLYSDEAKGTLRKESGKIKAVKKNIARMLTRLNELKRDDEK